MKRTLMAVTAFAAITQAAMSSPALAQAQTPAQSWPDKPVRLVLPYPPGGNVDSAARVISERLQQTFKQPFLVENKPGAGGLIAGEFVAKSAPDGYTFFMGANGPILFAPMIYRRTVYDWKKDFTPVGSVSFTPLLLQVNPKVAYKSFAEFLAAAKKEPGRITLASPGAGTTNHLVSEYLQSASGARWTTVHYKGNAPATTDLLGGQVDFNFDQLSVAQPYLQQGRTRALVVTSAKRLPSLPDVPTLAESGFPGFSAETFTGVMAPAATPKDIVAKFSDALQKILNDKVVQDRFTTLGAEARAMSPERFSEYLASEYAQWSRVIQQSHITAE